jgi:DNA (cytosine-5)-methyltransferase 1
MLNRSAKPERKRGRPPKPIAIDLFAGCGGLTEGLKQAGFRVVAAVEVDELAAKTYRLNHPRVAMRGDICRVKGTELMRTLRFRRAELDLLAGCPPCQGFSSMRTLNGTKRVADRRNVLVDEYLRLVRSLRPKAVMFENVPGLASRRRFQDFVRALKRLRYHVVWDVLDAADYGVPQRRRRLILLAVHEHDVGFAKATGRKRGVRGAIKQLTRPARSRDPLHKIIGTRSDRIRELIRLIPKNGGSRRDLPKRKWLECHKGFRGFHDVYGRMRWSEVAPTITGGCLNPSKGRFLHPEHNRAITVREAALLQTFPAAYQFATDRGFYPIAEMIGNALPPEFIRRQAGQVIRALRAKALAG